MYLPADVLKGGTDGLVRRSARQGEWARGVEGENMKGTEAGGLSGWVGGADKGDDQWVGKRSG